MGIDIGGTFTDFILCRDQSGIAALLKVPSTPADPSAAVMEGIKELDCRLAEVGRIVHGTTVGTNALIERRGAEVGLLTTSGFRDVLEIGRTQRLVPNSMFKPQFVRPEPLVPRRHRFEIRERMLAGGHLQEAVNTEDLAAVLAQIENLGLEAIAICFLHSHCNPQNEKLAGAWLQQRQPQLQVTCSSDVVMESGEYERFSTTVINAHLMPVMRNYLRRFEKGLAERGYQRRLFVMASSGGMLTSRQAQSLPVRTILSGPAGGVNGAVYFAGRAGVNNIITYDMGGTSTDVCLVRELQPEISREHLLAGLPLRTVQLEINAVGAGGGSIGWMDADGRLRVGPQSAGAVPGPAAYGLGGELPTITDANLHLGRLSAVSVLGGKIKLFPELAEAALGNLARRFPTLSIPAVAEGIIQIAVASMVGSIKAITIEKGHDPRDYTLVPYGGAGPMHAAFVGEDLGIRTILIPPFPGNLSAFGLAASDVVNDYVEPCLTALAELSAAAIDDGFHRLEEKSMQVFQDEGFDACNLKLLRSMDLRYQGQAFDLNLVVDRNEDPQAIAGRFHQKYLKRYGHNRPHHPLQAVNLRLTATALVDKPLPAPPASTGRSLGHAQKEVRGVFFRGEVLQTPVFDRAALPMGRHRQGPAIVEEEGATTLVPPQWGFEVDPHGNLILKRR